jgi:hypothetical protein
MYISSQTVTLFYITSETYFNVFVQVNEENISMQ